MRHHSGQDVVLSSRSSTTVRSTSDTPPNSSEWGGDPPRARRIGVHPEPSSRRRSGSRVRRKEVSGSDAEQRGRARPRSPGRRRRAVSLGHDGFVRTGLLLDPDVGNYAGRKDPSAWTIVAISVLVVASIAALWTTWRLIADLTSPAAACERELPWFEELIVTEVDRVWPPPLIRCEIDHLDAGQRPAAGSVTALTARHVATVAILDGTVVVAFAACFVRWRQRASRSRTHGSGRPDVRRRPGSTTRRAALGE